MPGTTVARDGNVACVEADPCWVDCPSTYASGETTFVGTVSTGEYAAAVFDFVTPSMWTSRLKYKKSWHFIDGRVLAIVSGITRVGSSSSSSSSSSSAVSMGESSSDDAGRAVSALPSVTTSLDQRWLGGDVWIGLSGQSNSKVVKLTANSTQTFPLGGGGGGGGSSSSGGVVGSAEWIYHDQTAYIMLSSSKHPQTLTVSNGASTGDWADVGAENGTVSGSIFSAFIEHNRDAISSSTGAAAYMVVPVAGDIGHTGDSFNPSVYTNGMTVVANNHTCHAIVATLARTARSVFSIVFFAAGTITAPEPWGLAVEALQPCTVIIVKETTSNSAAEEKAGEGGKAEGKALEGAGGATITMTVSDPSQSLNNVVIRTSLAPATPVHVPLPTGEFAGKSVSVKL